MSEDAAGLPGTNPRKTSGKLRLLTRADLDGRTRARRLFDSIEAGIVSDLGGASHMSTIEGNLAAAFAGAAVNVHHVNARLLAGEEIDLGEHATIISSLVRIAARLPRGRRAKNVVPDLKDYLAAKSDAPEPS